MFDNVVVLIPPNPLGIILRANKELSYFVVLIPPNPLGIINQSITKLLRLVVLIPPNPLGIIGKFWVLRGWWVVLIPPNPLGIIMVKKLVMLSAGCPDTAKSSRYNLFSQQETAISGQRLRCLCGAVKAIIPRGFGGIRTTHFVSEREEPSDYTERIWRYQDNSIAFSVEWKFDYTERIWRYQDNILYTLIHIVEDYTERIWRYQDNPWLQSPAEKKDYTERIWRYQDNRLKA